jgi:hypothetical protein
MPRRTATSHRWPPSEARIRALIEEAIVDASGEEEHAEWIEAYRAWIRGR